MIQVV